ncbi:hypothetical protein I316_06784 [Kwoniella heveanensis BCC8398]|uniref:Zn(2)-C6 fungal-type domain-containing protein n=1 Tax=Kwoniella heveanensis BCC8398 TaxID=1296120 RepID=A0A1B9GKW8_9TREE|nr:hypothetical protein I316_06784 [Kwoniella heveanensis BCC8398]
MSAPVSRSGTLASGSSPDSPQSGPARLRRTQRAPTSCIACARRKIKCSRTTPCAQCIGRGEEQKCQRELVLVRGRVIQGGSAEQSAINAKSIEELLKENEDLRRKVQELEQKITDVAEVNRSPAKVTHDPSNGGAPGPVSNELEKMATMMNLLEVGKSRPGDPRELPHGESPNRAARTLISTGLPLASLLPSRELSERLIAFATITLGWLYPTLPAPTFISEHEEFFRKMHWNGPLSLGPPCPPLLPGTLIDTALRIAKSLRIDHLTEERFCEPARELGMPCTAHGLVASHVVADEEFQERESRRRLWWSMIYRQWLSYPSGFPFSIPPEWLEVPLPLNIADQSIGTTGPLIVPPALQPTSVSYLIARSRVARQVHHFYLAYRPLDKTDPKRLDLIRETDSVLRHVVDDMPFFQDDPGWHPPSGESWTSEARYLIQVFINHKRLLLHRDYFAMAFTNDRYLESRNHCVDRAVEIVRLLRNGNEDAYYNSETSAYYLAAANVLALDTVYHPLYDTSLTPEEYAARASDIEYILRILKKSESSEHHSLSRVTGQIESLMSLYQMLRPTPTTASANTTAQVFSAGSTETQDFLQQQSDLGAEVLDNFMIGFNPIDPADPLWHPL